MTQFRVLIGVGNAAFDPEPGYEIARILREVADKIEGGQTDGGALDINGNSVGKFGFRSE